MTVVTGLGVILAISASMSLAEAGVVFASTTITPSLPMMMPVFPPAPPCVQYTSGFSCFTESGGGCCCAFAKLVIAITATAIAEAKAIRLAAIGALLRSKFLGKNSRILFRGDLGCFLGGRGLHILGNRKHQVRIIGVPHLDLNVEHRRATLLHNNVSGGLDVGQDFPVIRVIGIIRLAVQGWIIALRFDLGDKVLVVQSRFYRDAGKFATQGKREHSAPVLDG